MTSSGLGTGTIISVCAHCQSFSELCVSSDLHYMMRALHPGALGEGGGGGSRLSRLVPSSSQRDCWDGEGRPAAVLYWSGWDGDSAGEGE
jgi:hypothetical protein